MPSLDGMHKTVPRRRQEAHTTAESPASAMPQREVLAEVSDKLGAMDTITHLVGDEFISHGVDKFSTCRLCVKRVRDLKRLESGSREKSYNKYLLDAALRAERKRPY